MKISYRAVLFVGLFISIAYNVAFMFKDEPEPEVDPGLAPLLEMGYAVLELDGRQVVLDGHCNSVTREYVRKYVEDNEVPEGAGVILDIRRGNIIKMEVRDGNEEAEEIEESQGDDNHGDGDLRGISL